MTENDKRVISDLLDACIKKVDPEMVFSDQVKAITARMETLMDAMGVDVSINDPELVNMIKESAVITEDKPIIFAKGYTPWLNDIKPRIEWNFYDRYEKYLVKEKKWNWGTIQSINETTDIVLDHMQNPKTDAFYGIKGLVMGDIQSGKTANYTALINKSIDAGYKLIIVLAGLTKDLRSQTQKRLDKEVLGYETRPDFTRGQSVGVGKYSKEDLFINAITHSGDSGDLKKSTADAITTVLNNGMQPLIAVLKKNSSVLKALINGVLSNEVGAKTNGKFDVPVLIIDDEVDQASVNTKDQSTILESSTINKLIRTMLSKFNRYAYVGYTATPFANVFINPYGFKTEEEKDIFPEDFIVCLPRPKSYCGVSEYFGVDNVDDDQDSDALLYDLCENIKDYYDLFDSSVQESKKVKASTPVVRINSSMEEAFIHFIIASAVKYSRGIIGHNSMLIHVARFKNPSTSMRDLVKEEITNLLMKYKYGGDEEREKYKIFWENKIKPVSENRLLSEFNDNWEDISKHIIHILEMSVNGIKVVNGDSGDVCDYESSEIGQHIIIGGDKLSRGLTLEGLLVSYYYRNSRAYDTLLQMGRWFGYRNGWIDLCRIYTSPSIINDFINAGIATEQFKQDIEEMNSLKLTPAQFGLKVMYSPRLAPTSSSKMRTATKQKISFSESLQQLLSYRKEYIEYNRNITKLFLEKLGEPIVRENGNHVYKNIDVQKVLNYLGEYKECDDLVGSVSIKNWIRYIEKLSESGELTNWTIVLHSNAIRKDTYYDEEFRVYKNQNTDRNVNVIDSAPDFYLKAVTSPSDFKEFYDPEDEEYKTINAFKAGDPVIQKKFTKENGVLAIYSVDVHRKLFEKEIMLENGSKRKVYKQGEILSNGEGVIGLGVWFSKASNYESSAVDYYVNPVYLKSLEEDNEEGELQ